MPFHNWKFATEIKAPAPALDWLEQQLTTAINDDEWGIPFAFQRINSGQIDVWVERYEDGDPFVLIDMVAEMQTQFALSEPWSITWGVVPEEEDIGDAWGGAAVCYRGQVTQIKLDEWTQEILKQATSSSLPTTDNSGGTTK